MLWGPVVGVGARANRPNSEASWRICLIQPLIEILASLPQALRRAPQPALGEGCVVAGGMLVPAPMSWGAVGAGGMLVPASPWVGDHWGAGPAAGVVLAPAILLGGGQLACRVKGCAGDGDEESDSADQGECDDDGDVWKR